MCAFGVKIGDRLIQGKVEEREKAFEKYDEAMAKGYGGFLLDQEKPNIFIASIGNLMPGQEAVVSITYVAELPIHDDQIRLMIPTTVSPRYAPADADPVKVDAISPPVSSEVPYFLSVEVCLREADQIAEVFSPSHKIKVHQGEDVWKISLPMAEKLDRDFILEIKLKEPKKAFARVQTHENGDRAVMLRLYPEFEPEGERSASEVIFVLDCSGSMQGSSIDQAKRALELCLRTLSADDRFNVIRFGDRFEKLFEESREYTDYSLEQAVSYVRGIDADLGGTELYPALRHILDETPLQRSPRQELLILTDGQVSNEEEIVSLARSHRKRARIFSFGIGYGASESLVRGLARASGGAAEFISPDEGLEEKILRQFSRLATPTMTEVRIDWKGLRVKQSPSEIPPIFSGDSFTVYGLLEDSSTEGEVSLSAKIEGKDVKWFAPICSHATGNLIPTLCARSSIRDLEDGAGLEGGSRQISRKAEGVKKMLVEIGTRFQLASSETSFVAVETRSDSERVTEQAEYRRVPIQLTRDWHGQIVKMGAFTGVDRFLFIGKSMHETNRPPHLKLSMGLRQVFGSGEARRSKLSRKEAVTSWILDLLQTQTAAGSFDSMSSLPKYLPNSIIELKKLADQIEQVREAIRERVLATVLTLILLETRAQDFEKLWKRGAAKAKAWLATHADAARLHGKPIYAALIEIVENPWGNAGSRA